MNNPSNDCPTDVKLTSMGSAQFEKCMAWDDWRLMSMFQIFAAGVAQTAGLAPSSDALTAGMDAVFTWYCKHGIPLGGEKDVADVASELAIEVASLIYEPDDVDDALATLSPKWKSTPCAARVPAKMLRSASRSSSRRSAHRSADRNPGVNTTLSLPQRAEGSPPEAPELKACVEQYVQDYGMSVPQAYRQCAQDLKPPMPKPSQVDPDDVMDQFFRDVASRKPSERSLAAQLRRDFMT